MSGGETPPGPIPWLEYGGIGGFGVGSQLTWQAFGGIGYRFNELISAAVGYRGLGMDYTKGYFELNTVTHGPVLGLEFSW